MQRVKLEKEIRSRVLGMLEINYEVTVKVTGSLRGHSAVELLKADVMVRR